MKASFLKARFLAIELHSDADILRLQEKQARCCPNVLEKFPVESNTKKNDRGSRKYLEFDVTLA